MPNKYFFKWLWDNFKANERSVRTVVLCHLVAILIGVVNIIRDLSFQHIVGLTVYIVFCIISTHNYTIVYNKWKEQNWNDLSN